ncbi:L-lactate permease [Crassaminicella profunda]|uniref:L-lactate permease n=1 Tax=Crassaminicella profunda TaxID=1286698 RepID=UPI001CA6B2C5|nr:L-lactate permease [Crassaminicella profunda]QZY54083.1 L-lactate permease [Crassaminicella profunda]
MMMLLAILPIVVVLVGMIVLKKSAVIVSPFTLIFTIILSIISFNAVTGELVTQTWKGVMSGGKIIFLVWAAFAMLVMLQKTRAMDGIKIALASITDDKRILLIMIGFCFSIFLEGAAGAGTPTAICAPFLVGIGFTPLSAAIAGMLGAGIAPSWGGAGATTIVGHSVVAEHIALQDVTAISGRLAMLGAFVVPIIMIYALIGKKGFKGLWGYLLYIGAVLGASFFVISNFIGTEIVSLGCGAIGIIASLIYVKVSKHQTPEEYKYVPEKLSPEEKDLIPSTMKSFAPYLILIIALPVIRFSFPLAVLAKYGYVVWIAVVMFIIVFIGSIILNNVKGYVSYLKEGLIKVIPAFISMGALLSVANIMKSTGMLNIIAQGLADIAGSGYPVVAVLIGSLGTFIAGTGLGSNVMFGPMHMQAAELLSLNKVVLFSAQNVGGAIGNMICPNNIVAAAATVDTLGQEGEIMKKCIPSWLVLVVIYGVAGLLFAHVLFPTFGM